MPVTKKKFDVDVVPPTGGRLLTCDSYAFKLLMNVNYLAKLTRDAWLSTPSTISNDLNVGDKVLVNCLGQSTVLPDYKTYSSLWEGLNNPFDVEWLDYDMCDERGNKYVQTVIETLTEQIVIWAIDHDTRQCKAFIFLCEFADCLDFFYGHVVNSSVDNLNVVRLKIDDDF